MYFSNLLPAPLAALPAGVACDRLSVAAPFHVVDSEAAITALIRQFSAADFDPNHTAFPNGIGGVYTDIAIAEYRLRVYVMVRLSQTVRSLFLIMSAIEGSYLPIGSRLTVEEDNLLTSEQGLQWTEQATYVYTQVFGNWEEKFTIQITLPNAHPKELASLMLKEAQSLSAYDGNYR